jgi:site-specific DNA recombinase
MRHVYAYIRVSTQKQGETGSSLAEQRIAIDVYAKRNNLTIVEWFEEQETAAKRGRAIFTAMLALLLKGRAHGVIIHKIDRGARNLRDWADLGALIDRGIEVHFAHESLDMQSRGGRLAADIQAVVAADYIRNLRDEVKKGFYGRLRQGLYPLPAPIGYRDQGRGLPKVPDPVMGPLVQHAFALYETGRYNLRTLGSEMHRRGLRNRRGGRVTRTGLSTMLNNSFYIGLIFIRRTGESFSGAHEPLVRKSQFDRVQKVLRGRTKNSGLKHEFRYRKTLRCSHCGYNLIAELQKGFAVGAR